MNNRTNKYKILPYNCTTSTLCLQPRYYIQHILCESHKLETQFLKKSLGRINLIDKLGFVPPVIEEKLKLRGIKPSQG